MAKTIPQLTEITTLDSNTLIPVDSSIQTYKVTLPNLAKGVLEQAPTNLFTSIWNSAKTYASGDVVFYVGAFYKSLAGSNTNKIPTAAPIFWKKVSQSGLNPQASSALATRAVSAWTQAGTNILLNEPCYSPELGRWVAGSYTGDIYYSDDGAKTWVAGTPPAAGVITNWADAAWSPSLRKFVMVGFQSPGSSGTPSTYQICYSTNGSTWTAATNPATLRGFYAVCWLEEFGKFVAVGGSETLLTVYADAVVTSADGVTWTQQTAPEGTWFGLTYSPKLGRLLACSYTSSGGPAYDRFMYSDDAGVTWNIVTITTDRVTRQTLWIEELELFLVTTNNDVIMYSQDGLTFADGAVPGTSGNWYDVAWSPELGVAVCVGGGRDIIYSLNGLTWLRITNALSATDNWARVVWSAKFGYFVAVNAGITGSNGVSVCRHVKQFVAV